MKTLSKISLLIPVFALPLVSFAEEDSIWVMLEGGATFSVNQDNTNTVALPNDAPPSFLYDDYQTTERNDSYLIGVSVGYEFELDDEELEPWFRNIRLGLGYEFVGETKMNGQVHLYQEQPYYNYDYETYSQVAWAIGQIDLITLEQFTPFIDLGLGISFNHAGEYNESRINDAVHVRESADFSDNTETEFAWRAGLGINYQYEEDSPLTIGAVVRYSDLGDASTGSSQTYPTVGSLSEPITNIELALQLGYYF